MEEFYGFFDGVFLGHDEEGNEIYDREYDAGDLAEVLGAFFKDGIFPSPSTRLMVQATDNFKIKIYPGQAFIKSRFYKLYENKEIRIEDSDINFDRVDRVVIRFDEQQRNIGLKILTGIPTSNPKPVELTRTEFVYELCLAEITVKSKSQGLQSSNIKDTRFDENLCGIVATSIENLDIEDIRIQYEQLLKDYSKEYKGKILDLLNQLNEVIAAEDIAGKLIALIDSKQDKVIKDRKTSTEYVVVVEDSRPYLEVVKI